MTARSLDPATGTADWKAFHGRLRRSATAAAETGEPLSLLMVDVDHLTGINGRYGRPAGDRLLEALAGALRDGPPEHGAPPGRYGGGATLVAILPRTALAAAVAQAERIRAGLRSRPAPPGDGDGSVAPDAAVTASIGVAQYRDGEPLARFLHRAAAALARAKRAGRDRVVADPVEDTEAHAQA